MKKIQPICLYGAPKPLEKKKSIEKYIFVSLLFYYVPVTMPNATWLFKLYYIFNSHTSFIGYSHFAGKETEAQRGEGTCWRPKN